VRAIIAISCTTVAPSWRTCCQKCDAEYRSAITRVAPATSTGVRAASWKLEWHAGIVVSSRSPGRSEVCHTP